MLLGRKNPVTVNGRGAANFRASFEAGVGRADTLPCYCGTVNYRRCVIDLMRVCRESAEHVFGGLGAEDQRLLGSPHALRQFVKRQNTKSRGPGVADAIRR